MTSPASRPANRLAKEKSPYLLQHAHNPVDWYAWGDDAFARAKKEDKPIFLSIGYSTCHWCHVMERESFESERVAEVMNRLFVCVKVDREERPDVDGLYMAFVQATTGSGGWPMSVWLTPDGKPFYGGTYFPPEQRFGRPGFVDVLEGVAKAWREQRAPLLEAADKVIVVISKEARASAPDDAPLGAPALDAARDAFERSFDEREGGFGGAPKFPRPSVLLFLLREHARTGNAKALEMVSKTLAAMAKGGMNDQLGGGFHRYSVDARWHVPHFEKMLYDQGQLAVAYAEGFRATKDPLFAETLRATCDYVLREMTDAGGAFHSAEDADSAPDAAKPREKKEGAFYVFSHDEVKTTCGDAAAAFALRYGVEESGNADDPHGELTGQNVLFVARDVAEVASRLGEPADAVAKKIESAKRALLALRAKRPRPHRDDKVLVGWNGLMISGLAHAAMALDEPRYADAAARAARFLESRMLDPKTGELRRRYRDGDVALRGQCDDYAFFVQGLLDLFEATFDRHWCELAERLARKQDELFLDPESGAYFSSPAGDASVLVRMQEDYDGAEPAPGSVAARNALRLAELTGETALRERAERTARSMGERLRTLGPAVPQMLVALELLLAAPQHVVIAGDPLRDDAKAMLRAVRARFLPHATTLLADGGALQAWLSSRLPFVASMKPVGGKASAYVCVDRACKLPVTNLADLENLLGERPSKGSPAQR